jgi:UDP-glucose 4-epimerase
MDIDGARILVTGGAGLIGSTTIDLLLRDHAPAQIVVLDDLVRGSRQNLAPALRDARVQLVCGDVSDPAVVRSATEGMDAVIHLAALRITACAADPRRAMEVMAGGSFNVVEAARAAGVARVVAASSASVYGLAEHFPTREDHHPYGNQTLYGATKLLLEGLLRAYHAMHGLPYVAMRYFNVYGPRMDRDGKYTEVMIQWMGCLAAGEPPAIFGDGTQTMDFVYIDDVARANVLALRSDMTDEVFNVASGTETSLGALARALARVMGADQLAPAYGPERSVNPVPRRLASTEKAERLLGFRAEVGLDEGLRRLVHWWRGAHTAGGQRGTAAQGGPT